VKRNTKRSPTKRRQEGDGRRKTKEIGLFELRSLFSLFISDSDHVDLSSRYTSFFDVGQGRESLGPFQCQGLKGFPVTFNSLGLKGSEESAL
jgi:hypothetical protein